MIQQDLEEASNKNINYIEYLAHFINKDMVSDLIASRKAREKSESQDPEVFADILKKQFGREVEKDKLVNG